MDLTGQDLHRQASCIEFTSSGYSQELYVSFVGTGKECDYGLGRNPSIPGGASVFVCLFLANCNL